jgi:hypothetical protein
MGVHSQGRRVQKRLCQGGEKMQQILRNVAEMALFVFLVAVVTGIWTCLWLPPF